MKEFLKENTATLSQTVVVTVLCGALLGFASMWGEAVKESVAAVERSVGKLDAHHVQRMQHVIERMEMLDRHLTQRMADLERNMRAGFETVDLHMDRRFEAVYTHIDLRFDAVDGRFDAVDERFDAVDERMAAVEERMAAVEKRLVGVATRKDVLPGLTSSP